MRRPAAAACGLLLLAAGVDAVVTVAAPPQVRIRPGETAEGVLRVTIAEGFKVQANPAADEYLVPLRLDISDSGGVRLARVEYPAPQRHRLRGADSDLLVYEGEVELAFVLEAGPEASPGAVGLDGRLHYQACNSRVCLRPDSAPLRLAVEVDP